MFFFVQNHFCFQGGLSFKEWIVLGENLHDNKPLKVEPLKNYNIVGGNTNYKANGTHQNIVSCL